MASNENIEIEKMVNLNECNKIKGDPGRDWIAPIEPVLAAPPTDNTTAQSSGTINLGGDNSSGDGDN